METIKYRWDVATNFAGGVVSERWWETVKKKYSEDGRIFHNQTYLLNLFALFTNYESKFKEPLAVVLAIFFHKYVCSV